MGRNPDAGSGGGASIRDGAGRLTTSNLGDYDGRTRVSRRISSPDRRNADIRFTFRRDSSESYPIVVARADAVVNFQKGHQLSFFDDSWGLGRIVDRESVWAGQVKLAFRPNTKYTVRFAVTGNHIRGKVRPAGRPEPKAWGVDYTDSTYRSAGAIGLSLGGGKAAESSSCYFDDVRITG